MTQPLDFHPDPCAYQPGQIVHLDPQITGSGTIELGAPAIVVVPVIGVFLVSQKHLVHGLSAGAAKG